MCYVALVTWSATQHHKYPYIIMKQSMKSEFKNSNLNFSEAFRRTRGGHHCVHLRFDLKPMQFDRIRGLFFELMLASTPSPLTDLAASRKSKKGGTGWGDGPGDSRGRRAPWPSPWQRRCRHRSRPRPCPPLSLVSLRSPSTEIGRASCRERVCLYV